jgi:DNA-binding MarR family transcriptional regulator
MTKTYALKRLLEHGALTPTQIQAITGWRRQQVHSTLDSLLNVGLVKRHRGRIAKRNLYKLL